MRLAAALWFDSRLALRFLADQRLQTLLIITGIAVGAAVIVFITAIITGLQGNLIDRTLGSQSHIRFLPPDEVNLRPPLPPGTTALVLETPRAQRLRSIVNWQELLTALDTDPSLRAVSPLLSGPALARRGVARNSVVLMGIEPERYLRIADIRDDIIAGEFNVDPGNAVIGTELAADLGLAVGDKLRLDGGDGREALLQVSGIFYLGQRELDERWVYLDLRQAQTLLNQLGLLDTPSSGELFLLGQPTRSMDDATRTARRNDSIGFVFQFHHLITAFTVLENVLMPLMIRSGKPTAQQREGAAAGG